MSENFEGIIAEYGPLVTRIASSYEADPALQQDLVQQILLAVWQALPRYRGDASLKTFIARIAQNRSISHVAKRAREPASAEIPEIASSQPTPEHEVNQATERRLLMAAMRSLTPPQREVIVLVLEDFTITEISEMLDIPQNAVSLRLSRAKSALKALLEPKQ
ncbi:MAG: RNA polymerase sigma factor [Sphingomonadaceae bacterium]